MTTATPPLFLSGEVLIVEPGDTDDPEARLMQGQRCVFIKYVPHTFHCVVKFDDRAKPMYFRSTDLRRAVAV